MYFKRFLQLFIIFFVASAILVAIFRTNLAGNSYLSFLVALLIAYAVLILPLAYLTVAKARKKAKIVGSQTETGDLAHYLKGLPGFIALAVTGDDGLTSTTIMSFTQSIKSDNVFWMVAEKDTAKVRDLASHPAVSFTSWFDRFENGARLSSNRATAEIFQSPEANQPLIDAEPNILDIHENALNMAIIKLTIRSVLYEDFKDGIKVLNFEQ